MPVVLRKMNSGAKRVLPVTPLALYKVVEDVIVRYNDIGGVAK
jgi:hypothetical protein